MRRYALPILVLLWPGSSAAQLCPDPAVEHVPALEAGDFEGALEDAKRARNDNPAEVAAYEGLVGVYLHGIQQEGSGNIVLVPERAEAVLGVLGEMLERWPDHTNGHLCRIAVQRWIGDIPGYLESLDAAVARVSDKGAVEVGVFLEFPTRDLESGHISLAEEGYGRILARVPDSVATLVSYGVVRMEQGELGEAARHFKHALSLAPDDLVALRNTATVSVYLQALDDAVESLDRFAELRPADTHVLFELATVEMARDPLGSIAAWDRYLARHAEHPDAELWAASATGIKKRLEEAEDVDGRDLLQYALAFIAAGAPRYAIPVLNALAVRVPGEAMFTYTLGIAYGRCGVPTIARRILERSEVTLRLGGGSDLGLQLPQVHYELGRVNFALAEFDESLRHLEATEQDQPNHPNLQYMLALVHAQLGNSDRARDYLRDCAGMANNQEYAELCQATLGAGDPAAPAPNLGEAATEPDGG